MRRTVEFLIGLAIGLSLGLGAAVIASAESVEIDGVVVDKAPPVEFPEYEEQSYWIVVETVNGSQYTIEGQGNWLGYEIGDKFKQEVDDSRIISKKVVDADKDKEVDAMFWAFIGTIVLLVCILVVVAMMGKSS